jgi:hypothetical protein
MVVLSKMISHCVLPQDAPPPIGELELLTNVPAALFGEMQLSILDEPLPVTTNFTTLAVVGTYDTTEKPIHDGVVTSP